MNYAADMHVHSSFSFDGKMKMNYIANIAAENGIEYVAFTEHLDLCNRSFEEYRGWLPDYFDNIKRLNDKYDGEIEFLTAVEFAEPHIYHKEFELVSSWKYDYILGAVHFVDGKSVAFKELTGLDVKDVTKRYYEEVYNVISYGGIDAFAHFDHIRRGVGGDYADMNYIRDIMKEMVKKDIALEVNTSGIRRTGKEPFPDLNKVSEYHLAGGVKTVLGSDTHIEPNFYDRVDETAETLRNMGLKTGVFKNRKFVELV